MSEGIYVFPQDHGASNSRSGGLTLRDLIATQLYVQGMGSVTVSGADLMCEAIARDSVRYAEVLIAALQAPDSETASSDAPASLPPLLAKPLSPDPSDHSPRTKDA
jgi:hypothetical protein